jgi:hypothetical protein
MTSTVKVLCFFCGGMSEVEPQYVNTQEPCDKCKDRKSGKR